jgi:transcriptional regulator with XRE-family HTH domain
MGSMEEDEDDPRHRKEVGERIATRRENKGLSQSQLAALAGISQPSLSAIETGKTVRVTAKTFVGICRALETTWEFLWDGSEQSGEDEAELLAIFRSLEPPDRKAVLYSARTITIRRDVVSADEQYAEQRHRRSKTVTQRKRKPNE